MIKFIKSLFGFGGEDSTAPQVVGTDDGPIEIPANKAEAKPAAKKKAPAKKKTTTKKAPAKKKTTTKKAPAKKRGPKPKKAD